MTTSTSASILSRLGKNVKANQHHSSGIVADKKDPNTPLPDTTKAGNWEGNAHRKLDKAGGAEPIDTSKGEAGQDDSSDKQDYSDEYAGIYKGKGSAEASSVIGKKLKESIKLEVNLDDMRSLLEASSEDEEFITESLAIFEATMIDTINTQIDNIVESANVLIQESVSEEVAALEEQIEEYLNVSVMEWAEDNRLVIEQSTRVNIAESFMHDLTNLMESYNIVLPEESVDLYEHSLTVGDKLIEENETLSAELLEAREELQSLNKAIMVESYIHDSNLTVAQAERLRNVSSEMEFINEDDFESKLNTISEGYIKRTHKTIKEGQVVKSTTTALTESDADSFISEHEETKSYVDPTVEMLAARYTK